ncbi:AAA family ATPase [Lutispora thermophila]|uniref:Predicted ATPase n=1 Tax=Lutispora thermophila DSM 19022 TaxID=1122184 RepID=A0A1M6CDB1_9FIRM|nr:AAA family ATPase [Lutispora thermophila]SHI59002.1 Predicted ATPase [Lutispora thermophila DSM 19022]
MDHLSVRLFSTPAVFKGEKRIVFPSRKIEALFYYVFVNKEATREELASLLWPEADQQTGRKNVRNGLYYMKKTIDMDAIISPNKSIVMFNSNVKVDSDIEKLLSDDEWIDAYTGDFLQGFIVKDEEALENWILESREKYRSIYVQKLYEKIKRDFKSRKYESVEKCARRLIEVDEYDEKAYRVLIKVLAEMSMYSKAVDVYDKLYEKLKKDLGIVPDVKTRTLYNNVKKKRSNIEIYEIKKDKKIFYGRQQELFILSSNYINFYNGDGYSSVMVVGEAGIGKTTLKDKFLEMIEKNDIFILESNCYQAEEEFPLRPWSGILTKVADIVEEKNVRIPSSLGKIIQSFFPSIGFNEEKSEDHLDSEENILKQKLVEESIISLIKQISGIKKTIIIFDDIQWMDNLSLKLLAGMMLHLGKEVFFLITCRNGFSQRIANFIADMIRYGRMKKVELRRFTKEEVIDFAKKALPHHSFKDDIYEKIYKETEGNTFFIVEYINSLRENREMDITSARINDILKSRFIGVSEDGFKILNIASVFFDDISLDILAEISGMDKLKLLDILDDLMKRFIIKESNNKINPSFMFTHQKLREFIYNMQSASRRQILHNRIGRLFENDLTGDNKDIAIYPKLIYHFSKCGDIESALKYSIKLASFYLDINHELFPILYDGNGQSANNSFLSYEDSCKYLSNIEEQLAKLKEMHVDTSEAKKLEVAFYHMKGRYLIRHGQYEQGIELIKEMIDNSLSIGDIGYVLKGYRQLTYYGIQTRDMKVMKDNIEIGLNMAKEYGFDADVCMFLRLYGLYKIMIKDYYHAEDLLNQCIDKFYFIENSEDKYCMHIAAAYSYLGDIRRYNMKFEKALEYYDIAISLCEHKMEGGSLAVFCTNAGQAAYDTGDYIRAKSYFLRAFQIYNKVDSIWGRAIAEGYMTLILIAEGHYKEALESLKRADLYSRQIKNPYEIGLIYRIKAEIKYRMEKNSQLSDVFYDYLHFDLKTYCEEGIKFLECGNDAYQIEILNMFMNNYDA